MGQIPSTTISEEPATAATIELVHVSGACATLAVQIPEDLLSNLCLLLAGRPSELIEADVEPLIDLIMQLVVLVTYLPWCEPFLNCFCLSRGAILIGATD